MRKIALVITVIVALFSPAMAIAERLDYVIDDKIIHVNVVDGEVSMEEMFIFDDEIVAIAEYLPKESEIIIDRGDGFWTFIGLSKNNKAIGAGISYLGILNTEAQFKSALKMLIEQIIDHASENKTGAKRPGFLYFNDFIILILLK